MNTNIEVLVKLLVRGDLCRHLGILFEVLPMFIEKLDSICLKFMGLGSWRLTFTASLAGRGPQGGLHYRMCTVVARPQQVWVQIQGKGGLGSIPEQRP